MNKRRQVADSNPKALAPSILSHSASSSSISSRTSVNSTLSPTPELRPTKSIIIGGGQPIVIPGQINITNDPKLRQQHTIAAVPTTSSAPRSQSAGELKSQTTGFIASLFSSKNEVQEALPVSSHKIVEQQVVSVEEFCPDGGTLDKGFLDDLPNYGGAGTFQIDDSDR